MTVRPINLFLCVGLLLAAPVRGTAQEQQQDQETLEQRYQPIIDTVIARLQLTDSTGQQFRTSVVQYLTETEALFAKYQGKADRASMETMTTELDEAREQLDTRLETFLSKAQVAQVRTIMDDLRRQAREADADSGP